MKLATACFLAASIVNSAAWAIGQEAKPVDPSAPRKSGPLIAYELTIVNIIPASDDAAEEATEVDLAKFLATWEEQGRIQWQKTMRLTAVENQAAFVQFSERQPVVTGTNAAPGGRRGRSLSMEEGGVIFGVTGVVEEEGTILFEVDAQHSYFPTSEASASADADDSILPKMTEKNQAQTTVRCHPGKACLIGSMEIKTATEKTNTLLFVSAHVVK